MGADLSDENLKESPRRWAEALAYLTRGHDRSNDTRKLVTTFRKACELAADECHNLVVLGGPFHSLCAHHLLPFFGEYVVGYIPGERIIGASKIQRIVNLHSAKLQSQEHLAHHIAETLTEVVKPQGVGVWLGGKHLCMVTRGVEEEGTWMEVEVLQGTFRTNLDTRNEFLSIVNRRGVRES